MQCRIVLESSPAFTAQTQTAAVTPGQSVTFTLTPADGYTLTGADYPGASLTRTGAAYILTLPDVATPLPWQCRGKERYCAVL